MNYEAIKEAIIEQIKTPALSYVNSESGFVCDRLRKAGYIEEANSYWNWVTMKHGQMPIEIQNLHTELMLIGKQTIPDWGYAGT